MQGNETIYFEESKDGDTFVEKDNNANGFVLQVWINGSRVRRLVLDTETGEASLYK